LDVIDWLRKVQINRDVLRVTPFEMSVCWNPAEAGYNVWAYIVYANKVVSEITLKNREDLQDPAALTYKSGAHQLDGKVHITTLTSELPKRVALIYICLQTVKPAARPHTVKLARKGPLIGYDPVSFKLGPSAIGAHTVLAVLRNRESELTLDVINSHFPVTKPRVRVNGGDLHG
jgi:hypothetical protein